MRKMILYMALILCSELALADSYTDAELQAVGWTKNVALSNFLDKQNFPKQFTTDVAQNLGLLRDGDQYGSKSDACKEAKFFFADFAHSFGDPLLMKTIAPDHKEGGMSKAEYQREWDKVFAKFGKPSEMEVSKKIFPTNTLGMIEFANYQLNWHQKPLLVAFYISGHGCLRTTVFYKEDSLRSYVDRVLEKRKQKKDLISDSLE